MAIFSFRAECSQDVANFRAALKDRKLEYGVWFTCEEVPLPLKTADGKEHDVGEVAVLLGINLTIERIREIMRMQPDSHIMIQSLRELPLSENTLKRDHNIE